MREKLINGSKLFFINYDTNEEEYAVYSYGYVIFKNGNQIPISNYNSNLHYIHNQQYDVIRIENPKEFEIIEEDKEIEKMITLSGYDISAPWNYFTKINEIVEKVNELIDEINKLKKGELNK